jgi:DNA ligase-1
VDRKQGLIQSLLVASKESEALWIIRSLQGKLRVGVAEKTMQVALAHALVLTPPDGSKQTLKGGALEERMQQAADALKAVYNELPNYDLIVPVLLKETDIEKWTEFLHLTPGIPVKPMLAHPTKGIDEVIQRFADRPSFSCEWKYDGERAQIHYTPQNGMKIYSRNLEDNTAKYPDIVQNLPKAMEAGTESFILDCEVVAFDRTKQQILPFQILSTRARKSVELADVTVQICLFAFDLLYLNGQPLVRTDFKERRELLHRAFKEVDMEFKFAEFLDTTHVEDISSFLAKAVAGNCEGLMIKALHTDSAYIPGKRSFAWLKVKKDYLTGMTDSLDLVPIGAYYGKGKRTGVYGAYLLACYDPNTEEFQNVCKIGTGFSDEELETMARSFEEKRIAAPRPYYRYSDQVAPDVWFDAGVVWEVKAADFSLSPHYKAALGLVSESKGISLRFPRFIRVREDKSPEDATSAEQLAEMYRNQYAAPNKANK